MLAGRYERDFHRRRITIPAAFRKVVKGRKFFLFSTESTLSLFPVDLWNDQRKLNLFHAKLKKQGFGVEGFCAIALNKDGRIIIPQATPFEHTKVVIIGIGDYIEVWALEKWNELVKESTRGHQ